VRLSAAEGLRAGNDYVVIARRAALELPFDRLLKDFAGAIARVHQERRRGERAGAAKQAIGPSADQSS
jgi:ribonuclease P protein component